MSSLATVGNGGDIQNTVNQSGGSYTSTIPADLIFTSDAACSTPLAGWEFESYNSATGAVNVWINIGTLSHSNTSVIYMCYGNAAVTTQQMTTTATWDANYKVVYHLPNGSSLNANDSSINAVNGTNLGCSAGTGQIDGALSCDGGNGHQVNTANNPYSSATFSSNGLTLSAWVNPGGTPGVPSSQIVSLEGAYVIDVNSSSKLGFEINGSGSDIISSGSVPNSTWTYIVGTADSLGNLKMYINGSPDNTGSQTYYNLDSLTRPYAIGGHSVLANYNFFGIIDETRISNTVRSADQILAEYNNQSSPNTFYTVGPTQTGGGTVASPHADVTINKANVIIKGQVNIK